MRVDERTRAAEQLRSFVEATGLPVLGYVRDTQNYVQLAARGLTVFDLAPERVVRDLAQWQAICRWLDHAGRRLVRSGGGRNLRSPHPRCLPTIPASSNIVTCGLPNTASSLASALMARLLVASCKLLALM